MDTAFYARQQARERSEHAAQYMHTAYGLPLGRHTARHDGIHIFDVDQDSLAHWLTLTGGHITVQAAGHGVVMRTLHTTTDPDGRRPGIPVQVHVLDCADELVMPEVAAATLRPTAA
ncbi:hypothetical protein [Streptomyces sp. 8L]|uniref:hypothetical protein n=1 Tax=Streptomyces sp. 8L TaxID=2877242 RepID=UPI001CD7006A|nr:hypothetical protein [Streptomyces sp. 8L]MCA1224118.1 hypothetical protein [Streptomyces sp. 8L]